VAAQFDFRVGEVQQALAWMGVNGLEWLFAWPGAETALATLPRSGVGIRLECFLGTSELEEVSVALIAQANTNDL
jgi:hypothetical protein